MSTLAIGFLLRLGQVALESALTLLIGVVVAGVLRRMLGPAGTRRLFGRGWRGLLRGWTAGMLLPVCSLGVIPVAREMRRSGVPGGTVLAFVLAAPLLNPISFLYGLTLAEPTVILAFAAASLVLSTLAGFLWDRAFAGPTADAETEELARKADAEPVPAEGPRRLLAVAVTAGKEVGGRDLVFYAVGLVGSAALAALIPFGSLGHSMMHSDPWSPLFMTAVGVPVYSSPLPGMMKIGLMFDHGNSVGAAFVLFALGIGTSLGTLAWLGTDFGWRRVLPWLAAYAGITVGLAYLSEPLLYDARKAEAGHTHAFDDYSSPFPAGTSAPQAVGTLRDKLAAAFGPLERPPVYALGALLLVGLLARRLDRYGRLERWLTAAPPARPGGRRPWWDVSVPGPVLGGLALAGLVAFSVIGAFVYYPDRARCFDDMSAVYAEAFVAVRTGKGDEAARQLERWDLLVRKLEVGEYLRSLAVAPEQSRAAADLRAKLEEMRDELLARQYDEAKALLPDVDKAYRAVKAAYPRNGGPPVAVAAPTPPPLAAKGRPLTRLIWQDHAARRVRWADVAAAGDGSLSLGPVADVDGFPPVDPARQTLVQMKEAGGLVLCGVRDDDDGKHGSGWVLFTPGVRYLDHGDHGHWLFRKKPQPLDSRIDADQGNPAHLYVYDGRFFLANDVKNGYTRFDPAGWSAATGAKGTPRFFPGGGNHITLATVDDKVGYGCWIDGGGPNAGRVDVTPLSPAGEPKVAYSFKLPTGVIHGAAAAGGKVFFAPADGVCWVAADREAKLKPEEVKVQHVPLGTDGDKPRRTGAFEAHGTNVLCVTGKDAGAALVVLDAAAAAPAPVFVPLAGPKGTKPTTPAVVAADGRPPLALVFHDRDKGSDAAERLDVVALDPDGDGKFADAKVVKSLAVGPSAVDGHHGHHAAAADASGEFAFVCNPGAGTVAALDLKRLEFVAEFPVGGTPTTLLARGGRETDD